MAERKPAKKGMQSAKSATGKASKGFTAEERAAMRERAQELKAAARRGPGAGKADGENAVLEKIAAMPEPDRAIGERLHAIVKASAPALSPKLWLIVMSNARPPTTTPHSAHRVRPLDRPLGPRAEMSAINAPRVQPVAAQLDDDTAVHARRAWIYS